MAITSLEFDYLHRKSRCEMQICGDDISNDVITLGMCFLCVVYIRAHFRFVLIGANLTAQSTGSHRGIGGGIQIPDTQLQALRPLPALPPAGEPAGQVENDLPILHPRLADMIISSFLSRRKSKETRPWREPFNVFCLFHFLPSSPPHPLSRWLTNITNRKHEIRKEK